MSAAGPEALLAALGERLEADGLGPLGWLDAADYDALAAELGLAPLPRFGAAHRLAVVVASSRRSWPPLLGALAREPALRRDEHPLDRWAAGRIERAAGALGVPFAVRYPWEAGPRRVAFVRLAALAGLGTAGPAGLLVHPRLGPWLGLRAVVVLDAPPPARSAPPPPSPCRGCAAPCEEALRRALRSDARGRSLGPGAPEPEGWRRWLAVREACPVGREHRYGEAQLRYHYTKDRRVLEEALEASAARGG